MICEQISDVINVLVHLDPQPSNVDVTRIVCRNCQRQEKCPTLSMEYANCDPPQHEIFDSLPKQLLQQRV